MKRVEELVADKILDFINYILSKLIRPDITVNNVGQLDNEIIEKLKQKYRIEGIILDLDKTLRKNMRSIPKFNQDWIEALKGNLKIIILSNGIDKKIEKYFEEKGIDYIGFAQKPLKKNFLRACKRMNLEPEKVLVVGDSLFCDIYGGKRNNMKTVLVKTVEESER